MPRDAQLDALAEAILQHHMQQLNQPAPVAPTPPGFQGLGPIQAAAAAMNPQFAPQLIQQAQAPAQARYQQQQQAFEAAMAGKQQALAGGTQLLGMQSKEDIAGLRADQQSSQDAIANRLREMDLGIKQQGITSRKEIARLGREAQAGKERSRVIYSRTGEAFKENLDTGEITKFNLPGGEQAGKTPSETSIAAKESIDVLTSQLADFENSGRAYANKSRTLGSARATGQQFVRGLGETGQSLSEQYGDPEFEALASLRSRIGKQLARLVENNRLSDQDMIFALQQLPTVASLNTPAGRLQFAAKMADVKKEIAARIANRQALQPALFQGNTTNPSGPSSDLQDWLRKRGVEVKQ